jgi:hypothetical protein
VSTKSSHEVIGYVPFAAIRKIVGELLREATPSRQAYYLWKEEGVLPGREMRVGGRVFYSLDDAAALVSWVVHRRNGGARTHSDLVESLRPFAVSPVKRVATLFDRTLTRAEFLDDPQAAIESLAIGVGHLTIKWDESSVLLLGREKSDG